MAGSCNSKEKLNNTLLFIAKLLKKYDFQNWFISFGTLLGIVRDNSCIDKDDDIDIIIDEKNFDKLKEILLQNCFVLEYGYGISNSRNIIKTKDSEEYASIDFYMAKIKGKDYHVPWEHVIWSNCYNDSNELIKYEWNNEILNLPNDFITKLIKRYGSNWRIPIQNYKGNRANYIL